MQIRCRNKRLFKHLMVLSQELLPSYDAQTKFIRALLQFGDIFALAWLSWTRYVVVAVVVRDV